MSVIIPTHNRCASLRGALDSVYAQKSAADSFELDVIVVDDASTDATPNVVPQYPGTRYLRLPTSNGVAAARNTGLAASRGVYVAFLDDDDAWLPGKLSLQVPVLETNPEVSVVYSQYVVRRLGREYVLPELRVPPSGAVFHQLLMGNFCGNPAGLLLRRSALEAVGAFDERLSCAEDYDTWLRLAARFPFWFVPGIVAACRESERGHYATGIADGSRAKTMRLIIEKALARLPDTALSHTIKRQARLAWAINLVGQYPIYQVDLIRPLILTTLRECPALVGSVLGRRAVAQRARELAVASPCPLAVAGALCRDLRAVAGDGSLRHRLHLRRMLALVWAELTVGLLKAPAPIRRAAGVALFHSLGLDPSQAVWKMMASCLRIKERVRPPWTARKPPRAAVDADGYRMRAGGDT